VSRRNVEVSGVSVRGQEEATDDGDNEFAILRGELVEAWNDIRDSDVRKRIGIGGDLRVEGVGYVVHWIVEMGHVGVGGLAVGFLGQRSPQTVAGEGRIRCQRYLLRSDIKSATDPAGDTNQVNEKLGQSGVELVACATVTSRLQTQAGRLCPGVRIPASMVLHPCVGQSTKRVGSLITYKLRFQDISDPLLTPTL
jgi:hypothetical protein